MNVMPSRLGGGKGVTGCSLSKARWYAADAEGWMEDDKSKTYLPCRRETAGLLYTGLQGEEEVKPAAWPSKPGLDSEQRRRRRRRKFAACTG